MCDEKDASMSLNDYQAEVRKTDRAVQKALAFPLLGLPRGPGPHIALCGSLWHLRRWTSM